MSAEQEIQKTQLADIQRFLQKKSERLEKIYTKSEVRERILRYLYNQAVLTQKERASGALIFGTSLERFPDKFRKRVYWAAMLWHRRQINYIIFAGKGDETTGDYDQASDAKKVAVREFNIPPAVFLMAGGNNTQQNAEEAIGLIPSGDEIFAISENRHLIRCISVARSICDNKDISIYPNPVGGLEILDPHDPWVVLELIKAEGYNHTSYRFNGLLTQDGLNYVRKEARKMIQAYEFKLEPLLEERAEQPFQEWLKGLRPADRIQKLRYVSH